MSTLTDFIVSWIREITSAICFIIWIYVIIKPSENERVNWGIFFSCLYIAVALPLINLLCVHYQLWEYKENTVIGLPLDLYFIWLTLWGCLPVMVFKGKQTLLCLVSLFWLDFVFMPLLSQQGVFQLSDNWLLGEFITLLLVFLPAYLWSYCFINNTKTAFRASMQVLTVIITVGGILPLLMSEYNLIDFSELNLNVITLQFLVIVSLPGLQATYLLVKYGKGTPFPYDKTKVIVTHGVYAYIKNPIQWSFTFAFIPLAIIFSSPWLLIGSVVSFLYCISIANNQEGKDMEERFRGNWTNYNKTVPAFFFSFKPYAKTESTIYFKKDCGYCQDLKKWYINRKPLGINFKDALPEHLKVTYINCNGKVYAGYKAVLKMMEHTNLFWASLSWILQLPGLYHLVNGIVESLGLYDNNPEQCSIKNSH